MEENNGTESPPRTNARGRVRGGERAAIYKADTWHVDEGVASDGSGRPLRSAVRRSFTAEYKLAILAEYDSCTDTGEKGALLRREGLYSSIITDWRRQHRQGLLKANLGRSDVGRGGPSFSEVAKLRAENERLRNKLAQAQVVIDVQGKVHALLEDISKSAATNE
jgi:transposase-like protein